MIDGLYNEESRWFYRNPEKAVILYVGEKQQLQIQQEWESALKYWIDDDGSLAQNGVKKYAGYKLVKVDEWDYLRLGD